MRVNSNPSTKPRFFEPKKSAKKKDIFAGIFQNPLILAKKKKKKRRKTHKQKINQLSILYF
jgi:hypothetical protein